MRQPPHLDRDLADLPGEEWRDVIDFEGSYQVSNLGRLKSLTRLSNIGRRVNGRIRAQFPNGENGGMVTQLSLNGVATTEQVGPLVLTAFGVQPESEGMVAMHLNKIASDNRLANLRWATPTERNQRNWDMGLNTPNDMAWRSAEAASHRAQFVTDQGRICTNCFVEKPESDYEQIKGVLRRVCKDCVAIGRGTQQVGLAREQAELRGRGLKKCAKCKKIKPLTEFYRQRKAQTPRCKECIDRQNKKKNDE